MMPYNHNNSLILTITINHHPYPNHNPYPIATCMWLTADPGSGRSTQQWPLHILLGQLVPWQRWPPLLYPLIYTLLTHPLIHFLLGQLVPWQRWPPSLYPLIYTLLTHPFSLSFFLPFICHLLVYSINNPGNNTAAIASYKQHPPTTLPSTTLSNLDYLSPDQLLDK